MRRAPLLVVLLAAAATAMSGCARSAKPELVLDVLPEIGVAGEPVRFDVSRSKYDDSLDLKWDLDGDGVFEKESGSGRAAKRVLTASHTYPEPTTVRVTVTGRNYVFGGSPFTTHSYWASISRTVVIGPAQPDPPPPPANEPPVASFTVTPNPATSHQLVTLDASASADPDGRIVLYEWDLGGDGTYEQTTTVPSNTLFADNPGTRSIGLRVTDDGGATGETTRALVIQSPLVAQAAAAARAPGAHPAAVLGDRSHRFVLELDPARPLRSGTTVLSGDVLSTVGEMERGTARLLRRPAVLRASRRVSYVMRSNTAADLRRDAVTVDAVALLTARGQGRLCLGVSVAARGNGRPAVSAAILGGSHRLAGARGGARGLTGLTSGRPRLGGRLHVMRSRGAGRLPRACRGLVRFSERVGRIAQPRFTG